MCAEIERIELMISVSGARNDVAYSRQVHDHVAYAAIGMTDSDMLPRQRM